MVRLRQGRGRDLNDRNGLRFKSSGHGRTKTHGRRWIGQADLDLEGSGRRIGLWGDLADAPSRSHRGVVGEAYSNFRIARRRSDGLGGDVEDRIASILACKSDNALSRLDDFARGGTYRRQNARCVSL